jgi:hypothetical protein
VEEEASVVGFEFSGVAVDELNSELYAGPLHHTAFPLLEEHRFQNTALSLSEMSVTYRTTEPN